MIKGISQLNKNREVISRMQEIFMVVFGAKDFSYASDCCDESVRFDGIEEFLKQSDNIVFFKEANMVAAKITGKAGLLGLIKVEGFLFPQYIERYMELFSGILQIFAVVLQNLRYIENIEQQKTDLFYLNICDIQTNLYNRRYFEETLDQMDKEDNWALFICDMDGLKQINDNYGHTAGDEALRQAGILLQETFRESDVAARIGGDEFAVIVRNCDRKLAQRLQLRLAKNSQKYGEYKPRLHLSSGYAVKNGSTQNALALFKRADSNMYKIKKVYKALAKKLNKL